MIMSRLRCSTCQPSHRHDFLYQVWPVNGFPDLMKGYTRFVLYVSAGIRRTVRSFPDQRSHFFPASLGIRSVALHTDLAPTSPWRDLERRPILGLGMRTKRIGPLIVYRVRSGARGAWERDATIGCCSQLRNH
jgi:hypothetical protein